MSCDAPTRFEVTASAGHGSYDVRQMRGPGRCALRYNLYVDAARQRVWGDGIEAGTARIPGQVDGRKPFTRPIYARIPPANRSRPAPTTTPSPSTSAAEFPQSLRFVNRDAS